MKQVVDSRLCDVAMDALFSHPDYTSDQLVAAVYGMVGNNGVLSEQEVRAAVKEAQRTY